MKICFKCGNKNFYNVGDKIECKNCGIDLDINHKKSLHIPSNMSIGCSVSKRILLHDEMPYDFTHSD